MLYVVGLGLADEKDITVRGLEAVRSCGRVFLEAYTSILLCDTARLSAFYGVEVTVADRELVESGSDEILRGAGTGNVAFLVVGDPFGATTHTDLIIRARELGIAVEVIHNASIMNAIGACGLQLYNFGQCVSLVFFTETWKPASFYDRVRENCGVGLHTLMLLDIKVKEQSIENMARGRLIYEPPRYMTVSTAAQQMLEIAALKRDESEEPCYDESTWAIGVGRIGATDQRIVAATLGELVDIDVGPPLHSLVLLGSRVHPLELEYMKHYAVNKDAVQALIDEKDK
ncbi:Diphthine synthase [Taphrina deformans PYCC 5710]|uniref:diphthine methyl ester synthase n=1 Tax=Taphrina deformans (strain PYCC 5710 / ATCC 11124 / CBS 356.35 / IMI 108563 / JCM 9778 / NBRC 8474) TaxID=1097556 RepID=R4XBG8_TAPDE|nr:Diphthine synthase [Taphrina deformans PYCC 5710]|eukprot:CCG81716.1 Diphthine synthase [Taphrina deformans PYCC 5710]